MTIPYFGVLSFAWFSYASVSSNLKRYSVMCDILLQLTLIKKTFPNSRRHVFLESQKVEV